MRLSLILETNLALIASKLSISPDKLQKLLSNADPTNGKYKDYIIKLLLNKNIILPEDNHRLREALSLFHAHKNRLPVKDINRYKSLHELETTVEQHQGVSKRQGGLEINPFSLPGVEIYAKQEKYTTLKITNPDSLAELGEGTKWCTRKSYKGCQAERYIDDYDYIFIVLEGNKPIIQYTPDYEQIMDRNDEYVEDKELLQKLIPKASTTTSPSHAYNYAKVVLKDRYPEGERIIATNAFYAYLYARDILKGPFPKAERTIAANPEFAYNYAGSVLRGRFHKAEPIIAQDPYWAFYYAKEIIQGPFTQAEPAIATDPLYAYYYARDILKGPWPEAEPEIAKSPHWANGYNKFINTLKFD